MQTEIRNGTLNETPGTDLDAHDASLKVLQADFKDLKQQEEMHFQQLHNLISQKVLPPKGSFQNPTNSCKSIPPGSPSGKYWIQSTATGYASHEYCDMANTRCGTRGWMRVANLDMTDTSQHCPSGFRYTSGSRYRGCGTHGGGCVHTTFPVHGVRYSKVCGRVNAYQYYSPNAFHPYYLNRALTIDSAYVEGVSLTHGQYPRRHIWTFAAALDETRSQEHTCPCSKTTTTYTGAVPPFIGQDYFCDTGSRYHFADRVYDQDPLWDGRGCGSTSTCCQFNNPPWFCKDLPQPTTDDIEMRLCINEAFVNEDIILKLAEVYVQL